MALDLSYYQNFYLYFTFNYLSEDLSLHLAPLKYHEKYFQLELCFSWELKDAMATNLIPHLHPIKMLKWPCTIQDHL